MKNNSTSYPDEDVDRYQEEDYGDGSAWEAAEVGDLGVVCGRLFSHAAEDGFLGVVHDVEECRPDSSRAGILLAIAFFWWAMLSPCIALGTRTKYHCSNCNGQISPHESREPIATNR